MAMTEEQQRRHEELRQVKERIEGEYLRQDNVVGVGVGFKEEGGEPTTELAIRIYVRQKGDVTGADRIPETIEGYPTDVIEADFKPQAKPAVTVGAGPDKKRYNPLVGGISIAPSRTDYEVGTLGLMVRDKEGTGKAMMLSNCHVMCLGDGKRKVGDEICQEARVDNAVRWCGNCAKLTRWKLGNVTVLGSFYGIDAAVAVQTARKAEVGKVEGIGTVIGTAQPTLCMKVQKRGRTTEVTKGTIGDVSATVKWNLGVPLSPLELKNQILVSGDDGPFTLGGDSGSVYVWTKDTGDHYVVGLNWGTTKDARGEWSVGCRIDAVIAHLNISVT